MKAIDTTGAKRQYQKPAIKVIEIQTEAVLFESSEIGLEGEDLWP